MTMFSRRTASILFSALFASATFGTDSHGAVATQIVMLHRGVSLHNWFTWPKGARPDGSFSWPPFEQADGRLSPAELKKLNAAGLDFVRLTVDPAPFLYFKDRRSELFEVLRQDVDSIRSAGLRVILDVHPKTSSGYAWSNAELLRDADKLKKLLSFETDLVRFADQVGSDATLVELLNEPDLQCAAGEGFLPAQIQQLYRAARAGSSRLTLVVPLVCARKGAEFTELPRKIVAEPTLITFHYYDPYIFTAQGQKGEISEPFAGLDYPASMSTFSKVKSDVEAQTGRTGGDPAVSLRRLRDYYDTYRTGAPTDAIFSRFARAADAAGIAHDRVLLGEFSVNRGGDGREGAPLASYRTWLHQVRTDAEAHGFSWCFWAYTGWDGMILVKSDHDRELDLDASNALGLRDTEQKSSP